MSIISDIFVIITSLIVLLFGMSIVSEIIALITSLPKNNITLRNKGDDLLAKNVLKNAERLNMSRIKPYVMEPNNTRQLSYDLRRLTHMFGRLHEPKEMRKLSKAN